MMVLVRSAINIKARRTSPFAVHNIFTCFSYFCWWGMVGYKALWELQNGFKQYYVTILVSKNILTLLTCLCFDLALAVGVNSKQVSIATNSMASPQPYAASPNSRKAFPVVITQ